MLACLKLQDYCDSPKSSQEAQRRRFAMDLFVLITWCVFLMGISHAYVIRTRPDQVPIACAGLVNSSIIALALRIYGWMLTMLHCPEIILHNDTTRMMAELCVALSVASHMFSVYPLVHSAPLDPDAPPQQCDTDDVGRQLLVHIAGTLMCILTLAYAMMQDRVRREAVRAAQQRRKEGEKEPTSTPPPSPLLLLHVPWDQPGQVVECAEVV